VFLNSPCYETPKNAIKKIDEKMKRNENNKNRLIECFLLAPRQMYVTFVIFLCMPPLLETRALQQAIDDRALHLMRRSGPTTGITQSVSTTWRIFRPLRPQPACLSSFWFLAFWGQIQGAGKKKKTGKRRTSALARNKSTYVLLLLFLVRFWAFLGKESSETREKN
jgi:hypothetical protein